MSSLLRIFSVAIFLVAITWGALAQNDTNDADALRAADVAWSRSYETKDLEKAVAFCDDQGSLLWPNTPRVNGKDAITKATANAFAIPGFNLKWHPDQVAVARSGELGYTTGAYTWTFKDASGNPTLDKGKYLSVWKKQPDGSWKVLLDMFNTDLPQH